MPAQISWTKDDLIRLDSDFSSLPDSDFSYFATVAAQEIGESSRFGSQAPYAGALLTAHLLVMDPGRKSKAGGIPLMSESVQGSQGIAVRYAISEFTADDLSLSRFGIAYRRLQFRYNRGGFLL